MKTIISVLLLSMLFVACESKSGQRAHDRINASVVTCEKVVIIDSAISGIRIKYKVNRISKGVVAFIYVQEAFEKGDTILYSFANSIN